MIENFIYKKKHLLIFGINEHTIEAKVAFNLLDYVIKNHKITTKKNPKIKNLLIIIYWFF